MTSDYPPRFGGMAEYSDAWAAGLARRGFEVAVLTQEPKTPFAGRTPAISARRFRTRGPAWSAPFRFYRPLLRACREFRPHLVLAHTWVGWGPALAYLKGRFHARYVLAAHGAEILGPKRSPYYRFLMRLAFKGADAVFPVSRFTAGLVREVGVAVPRIHVVGNGVDIERFVPGEPPPDLISRWGLEGRRVLLTVGGLVSRKGQDIVIRALATLKEDYPNLVYLIAGGWALRESFEPKLRTLVRKLELEDRVIFTGYLEDRDLPRVYRLGEIFVLTGREVTERGWVEGFGISYLEAAASGLPIVAARSGGTEDAVTEKNAIFVEPENVEETAISIRKLLDDPKLRNRMSAEGRRWAEKCRWKNRIDAAVEVLRRMGYEREE